MNTRLFTVEVTETTTRIAGTGEIVIEYECSFAGIRFSRDSESDLKYWVRVAARNVYSKQTKIIFLHKLRGASNDYQ